MFRQKDPKPCPPCMARWVPCEACQVRRLRNSLRSDSARRCSGLGCTSRPCRRRHPYLLSLPCLLLSFPQVFSGNPVSWSSRTKKKEKTLDPRLQMSRMTEKKKAALGSRAAFVESIPDSTSHELHELFLGFVHEFGGDRGRASFLSQPFDFLAGHGLNEIRDVAQALLGFRRPTQAVR